MKPYPLFRLLSKKAMLIGCLLITLQTYAQLTVSFPVSRTVFQRDNANRSRLTIVGQCSSSERIDARLTAMADGQGQSIDWVTIDWQPSQGQFSGQLTALGGWYRLEVRAWRNGSVVATTEVKPVGVGEVFVIAGQSNGQGIRDRNAVGSNDSRVVCASHVNHTDTIRLPLPAIVEPLSANGSISPRGQTAWCWGRLGDRLTARLNVPVMFYNTAWSGTAVRNWRESFERDSTATSYGEYFRPGMPYGNLKRVLQDYALLTGVRAVLWHQGESEFYDTDRSASNYFSDLQSVIQRSRQDAGFNVPWMVARASLDNNLYFNYGYRHYEPVVSAQNRVVQQVGNVFYGPDTDIIQMPRTDGVHFADGGLIQLGDAWNDYLNDDFFRNAVPRLPSALALTDLSLRMQVDKRLPQLNEPTQVTLTVRNEGTTDATNVRVRCTLPAPLAYVSGAAVTYQRGVVLATLPIVRVGESASVVFTVIPTQAGTYQPVAELVRADQLDVDSRPNTDPGDGQDDSAVITFRTQKAGNQLYTVPVSVNAAPLPPVTSSQPPAEADKADLSLKIALSNLVIRVNEVVLISLTVDNRGGRSASNVQVACPLPQNLTFLDGSGLSQSGNVVRGTIGNVAPNGSVTVYFRATATQEGLAISRAQIEASSFADPDSTPNNGFANGEDDTSQVSLRVR